MPRTPHVYVASGFYASMLREIGVLEVLPWALHASTLASELSSLVEDDEPLVEQKPQQAIKVMLWIL